MIISVEVDIGSHVEPERAEKLATQIRRAITHPDDENPLPVGLVVTKLEIDYFRNG